MNPEKIHKQVLNGANCYKLQYLTKMEQTLYYPFHTTQQEKPFSSAV